MKRATFTHGGRTRAGVVGGDEELRVIHRLPVRNADAIENPEALEHFRDDAQLAV